MCISAQPAYKDFIPMKNIVSFRLLAAVLLLTATFAACHKDKGETYADKAALEIEFDHRVGDLAFGFGQDYTTAAGETIRFSTFDYFVSNFVLTKEDGSEYVVPQNDCYFLIRHDDPSTRTIKLNNIPGGAYTSARFIIGVDSLMSTKPAEQRPSALDPITKAAGMYWSWNSGYIFVKLEGTSPQAPLNDQTQERSVVYHIGGYGGNNPASPTMNNIKTVTLNKSGERAEVGKMDSDGHGHSHGNGSTPHLHVYVDVLEFFKNPTVVKVSDIPVVHWGNNAKIFAANYADMFVLDHIHN
jgi:hypothetical protein